MAQTQVDHVQRLREGYEAFGKGDLEALKTLFSPDIIWHVGGKSSFTGDYKGIDATFEFFMRVFTETGGTLKNEVHDILANDTHGIALVKQSGQRNGKSLSMDCVHVLHYDAEGRTTESWFIPEDAYAADEFWD
jgi:ketosteroid isomerase-like protein